MGYGSKTISDELMEMGISGSFLQRLMLVIDDEDELQKFREWMIIEGLKGEQLTSLSCVHKFTLYLEDEYIITSEIFVQDYLFAQTPEAKQRVVSAIIPNSNSIKLNKVLCILDKKPDRLNEFYFKVRDYRRVYQPEEIIFLLETLPF